MAHSAQQIADYEKRLKHFSALLDQGLDIPAIRERMGLSKRHAYNLWAKIRENKNGQMG